MSIVNPASAVSAPEPMDGSRTRTAPDGTGTPQASAPAAPTTPVHPAARALPLDNPGVDVIAVAELRRQAMLDALDPGPRPVSAARAGRRGFLSRLKGFYAQELIHDTARDAGDNG
ncbi:MULTISPECIES: hypothetical protein [unclassified Streptomyces]|uniref:hypothetical protein n=1 Tax=unclassified Streptomyces TaxID=2593676 RepID=UPI00296634C1|nr:hypothetical protein [Streptomyces sp. SJL17-1]